MPAIKSKPDIKKLILEHASLANRLDIARQFKSTNENELRVETKTAFDNLKKIVARHIGKKKNDQETIEYICDRSERLLVDNFS